MKTLLNIIVALLLLGALSACQNDEHIGKRFGMWKMMSININGTPDSQYTDVVFWCFQTGVIEMKTYSQAGSILSNGYGSCAESDNKLTLDFRYSDDSHEAGDPYYSPAPATYLPSDSVITLEIEKLTGSQMILIYHAENGTTYTYFLKKWG